MQNNLCHTGQPFFNPRGEKSGLERWQVERLFARVQQELHYLDKLEGRMHQKHFPRDDPLHEAVKKARAAINELSVQLHHLLKD